MAQTLNQLIGLSTRKSVQDSILFSPAGSHELYPKGSIVVCVSCALPIYRLERSIYIGESAGRSAAAYRPVRVADVLELRDRRDVDAGMRAVLNGWSDARVKAHCDVIPVLNSGDPLLCPCCKRGFVEARSSADPNEVGETRDRGYVIQLITIPPRGHNVTAFRRGKKVATSIR